MATLPQVTPHPDARAAISKGAARRGADTFSQRPSYACPRCLSTQVVGAADNDPWEWIINRFGFRNMHCRQCSHRFIWL